MLSLHPLWKAFFSFSQNTPSLETNTPIEIVTDTLTSRIHISPTQPALTSPEQPNVQNHTSM